MSLPCLAQGRKRHPAIYVMSPCSIGRAKSIECEMAALAIAHRAQYNLPA